MKILTPETPNERKTFHPLSERIPFQEDSTT